MYRFRSTSVWPVALALSMTPGLLDAEETLDSAAHPRIWVRTRREVPAQQLRVTLIPHGVGGIGLRLSAPLR
jgi:hypothetical protein